MVCKSSTFEGLFNLGVTFPCLSLESFQLVWQLIPLLAVDTDKLRSMYTFDVIYEIADASNLRSESLYLKHRIHKWIIRHIRGSQYAFSYLLQVQICIFQIFYSVWFMLRLLLHLIRVGVAGHCRRRRICSSVSGEWVICLIRSTCLWRAWRRCTLISSWYSRGTKVVAVNKHCLVWRRRRLCCDVFGTCFFFRLWKYPSFIRLAQVTQDGTCPASHTPTEKWTCFRSINNNSSSSHHRIVPG